MDFLPQEIEEYALSRTQEEPDVLKKLYRETYAKVLMPRMIAGHLQGRVLSMLSKMIRPEHILEIGTYTGYSAICLSEGLVKGGKLITIDINEELEEMARRYFSEAKAEEKIDFRVGDAMKIIPFLKETFDLVYIDADKEHYSSYFDLVFPKVKKGGYIIADNMLWSGKILDQAKKVDMETRSLYEYAVKIQNDSRVENLLLPVRDGLMIARKMV
jgi:predicted O-methyltransferase YrrM